MLYSINYFYEIKLDISKAQMGNITEQLESNFSGNTETL